VGRVNDHSSAVVGIDTGKMRGRLRSHSDACAAGAGDSTKVPDGGKVIVGQEAYRLAQSISSKPDSPLQKSVKRKRERVYEIYIQWKVNQTDLWRANTNSFLVER
jgi:hypothetical protein